MDDVLVHYTSLGVMAREGVVPPMVVLITDPYWNNFYLLLILKDLHAKF